MYKDRVLNILSKYKKGEKLTLNEKLLIEKLKNNPDEVHIKIYLEELQIIKDKVKILNHKYLYGEANNKKIELLEKLENKRKELLNKIKYINSKKTKIDINDFSGNEIFPSLDEFLGEISKDNINISI